MSKNNALVQSDSLTEEQWQQFRSDLDATFGDAQSAWDAYRDHLMEHGWLPSKT